MYAIIQRYLARVWTGDLGLAPTLQNYTRIGDALGIVDLTPLPLREILGGVMTPRIHAEWDEGVFQLTVRGESLDITYKHPKNKEALTFEAFLATAGELLAKAMGHFDRRASRIASVQEGVLREMSTEELAGAADRLLLRSPTFANGAFEWDWRVATKVERSFADVREVGNTLAIVKRLTGIINESEPFDRLLVGTDVNTAPEEVRERFTPQQVKAFFTASAAWHKKLADEILGQIGYLP